MQYLSPTIWRYNNAPPRMMKAQQIAVQDLYYAYYTITTLLLFSALWSTSRYRRLLFNAVVQFTFIYLGWALRHFPNGAVDAHAVKLLLLVNLQNVFVVGALCGWWNVTRYEAEKRIALYENEKTTVAKQEVKNGGLRVWCTMNTSDGAIATKLGVPFVLSTLALSRNPAIGGWQSTNQALYVCVMGIAMVYASKAAKAKWLLAESKI